MAARLAAGSWSAGDALTRLGSCTSEIVLFFVNGESYIGPECCVAIRGATRHCWPSMLAAAGFTAEEADVLRGFLRRRGRQAAPPRGPRPGAREAVMSLRYVHIYHVHVC
ncbi:hypothetical protein HU200_012325 [Digitaria exilis]|uniref:Prolamin-like domain-containing protein n=1 Tax=Digitaria exilis TaxID=1010633 RepID=A0A835KLY8_9POAL|nr:hypothetical protein HU200_012325 [Digitaria exilis]